MTPSSAYILRQKGSLRPLPFEPAMRRSTGRTAATQSPSESSAGSPRKTVSVSVNARYSWSSSRSAQAETLTLLKVGVSAKRWTRGSSTMVAGSAARRSTVAGSGSWPGRGANAYTGAPARAPPHLRRLSTSSTASLSSRPRSTQIRNATGSGLAEALTARGG